MYRLDKSRSTESIWWEINERPVGSTGPWAIRKRICFDVRSSVRAMAVMCASVESDQVAKCDGKMGGCLL